MVLLRDKYDIRWIVLQHTALRPIILSVLFTVMAGYEWLVRDRWKERKKDRSTDRQTTEMITIIDDSSLTMHTWKFMTWLHSCLSGWSDDDHHPPWSYSRIRSASTLIANKVDLKSVLQLLAHAILQQLPYSRWLYTSTFRIKKAR